MPTLPRSFTNSLALEPLRKSSAPAPTPPHEEVPTDIRHLAIMLTRKCNMSCAHCSVESGPKVSGEPDAARLLESVRAASNGGVRSILLTGGEPMLREDVLLEMLRECQRLGIHTALASNGFWGKTPQRARETVARLQAAGLHMMTISYDRYHADFQGPQPAVNIARAAGEAKLLINISVTRTVEEDDLDAIVAPFAATPNANLRFYDVQPIGRARDFDKTTLRGEVGGFCNACSAPALTDGGKLTACNGPSYFSAASSPLIVGDSTAEPLETLLHRHDEDEILEAIRTHGPQWLLGELEQLPGFENFARPNYGGMCDLCLHLNGDEAAVAALRAHLSDPKLVAERAARRQVIAAAHQGEMRRDEVNGAGVTRIWWRALRDPASLDGRAAEAILGRADLNWSEQLAQLSQCGLAGPMRPLLSRAALQRWAPAFWRDTLSKQAVADQMMTLAQRDFMRDLAAIAREVGTTGVLLKGGAMLALDEETQGLLPVRASSDIDVYFTPAVAARVHALLKERGWMPASTEETFDQASGHQLPALFRGLLCVEIHTTLLPQFCGMPERIMLRSARALKAHELRGLRVMKPEAMLLHGALHSSKHGWVQGIKLAYDVAWLCQRFPDLNWHWLSRLVARTGMKRGFWAPLAVLTGELELPIPATFMRQAPNDRRARQLEKWARRRLFGVGFTQWELNPFIAHAVYLLQSDSWLHRARHGWILARSATALRAARRVQSDAPNSNTPRAAKWDKLREAVRAWRRA